ncbi:MAG: tRNA threonylcarbamoyladenosine dehydratase [Oscillospiraceae bacterium]|nr:tRNA threonylcarbamoyladenosine dehydratase [Oscillospiraceae bacterium]
MEHPLIRFEMLVGLEGLQRLQNSRVAVFGLGGVGGSVVEALARAGVGSLDLIDNDRVALSNLNRQIIALHSTVGMRKVDAAAARARDINPEIRLRCFQCFYLPETRDQFDFGAYDYVVDCIDTVTAKLDLVMQCRAAGTPIICALGTGNKLDPTKLELADISETAVCPLARIVRKELRRRGVQHLKVLYSREEPLTPRFSPEPEPVAEEAQDGPEVFGNRRRSVPGSSPFVPPAAGLMIASAVVRDLLALKSFEKE